MISNISKRYARAFFEIAAEEKQLEKYYNELNQFSSIIAQNKALGDFLANPVFEQESKKRCCGKDNWQTSVFRHDDQFFKIAGR